MAAAASPPPLLFAAAPGVLAVLAPDGDARHAVTAQLLTASEGGELTPLGGPLRVSADEDEQLTPLAGGRAADARTGRRHAYVALLQRDASGDAASLRIGRLAPAESSAAAHGGWAATRWVHLVRLPLPPACAVPRACHVLDGPLLLLHLQDGSLFVAAPRAPPRAAPDALTARSSVEAAACAWYGAALRFALPSGAEPPALLLATWRVARGGGPAALLALRGVPPPAGGDDVAGPSAPLPPSSFALVPLLDALRDGSDACSAARLARYQRAAADVAPHALAVDATAACAVPAPASSSEADAADDVALALRGGRVLRLRSGVVAAEGRTGVDEGDAPTALHCVPMPDGGGAALLVRTPDWRASAAALCARTLRGGVAAVDVATALPLLGPPRSAAGGDDVIASSGALCAPGAALLLPRGLDAMGADDAERPGGTALLALRAAEGPAWAAALRGARVLLLPAALAAAAPPPPRAPGAAAVAAALRACVTAAADDAAAAAARIAQQGEAAAAARALLARCAAAACAAAPAQTLDMDDDAYGDDVAGGVRVVATSLRGAFCDDEWRVAADVALRGSEGAQLYDAALALLPRGNQREPLPLRGRAGAAAEPLRAGGPSATLVAAAPAAAVAAACVDDGVTVILTARLLRHPAENSKPGADAFVPFAAVLGRLQPQWAAVDAGLDAAEPSYDRGLPGWRRDAVLRCSAADLRAAPRALCAALRLAPDAGASEACGGVVLRPAAGGADPSLLPAGCAVRLAPRGGGSAAELTLTAPRRADGLRLARHVAAALPADVIAAPNAAAPPALAAAAALAEALREEIRAAIAAAEGSGGGEAPRCAAAALAADSGAALAVLLLTTAQD